MTPWKLPLIVAGIALTVAAGFAIGGPGIGVAVGALVAVAIVVIAVRMSPRGPIASAAGDGLRHVLIVIACPVEDPGAVAAIAREVGIGAEGENGEAEVLVLSPARSTFLDRWAGDLDRARHGAQANLVVTVAALAKAGIAAEARVGDEDLVQAVEDLLQSYAATEVVLVGEAGERDADAAASELGERLEAGFHHVALPCE
jgi:hypothetical protein